MSLRAVIWCKGKAKSKTVNNRPFLKESRDLIYAGDRQLVEAADRVEFLVVRRDQNASRLLRDGHQWARVRRGRVLDQADREVLVQGRVNIFCQNTVDAVWSGRDGRVTSRD